MAEMEMFARGYLLHLFKTLRWLGKLDVAHHGLGSRHLYAWYVISFTLQSYYN